MGFVSCQNFTFETRSRENFDLEPVEAAFAAVRSMPFLKGLFVVYTIFLNTSGRLIY